MNKCANLICPSSFFFFKDKEYVYLLPPKENCLKNVVQETSFLNSKISKLEEKGDTEHLVHLYFRWEKWSQEK